MRFVLIDRILHLERGRRVEAEKTLGPEEELFRDHFPGFPVVPGVLLTEMMAQAAGKCLVAERRPRGWPMLAQIKSASFRDWVRPGEAIRIFAEILSSEEQFATARCRVEVEARKVASAELFFAFLPLEQFVSGYRDEVLEAYLAEHPLPPRTGLPVDGA
jgi:3-hydroxyacyl-[acyl-carrier-protein] dehydratase